MGPKNGAHVQRVVDERLSAAKGEGGLQPTEMIEWRGEAKPIPVIQMDLELLSYNPDTHRIKAQRSLDLERSQKLESDPYSEESQLYLQELLKGDPANPHTVDPKFKALMEDLEENGQDEPGIITRTGVLINGNTRAAALRELGQDQIRVGVLPPDAGHKDLLAIELSLQLRKDHKRDYSFMNLLLSIDDRVRAGHKAKNIQRDFRIIEKTYEKYLWLLAFVRDTIERSEVQLSDELSVKMRLVDFEQHQGKLEELYRSYMSLKAKDSDAAERLREERLLALVLNKSKTDLRLIEHDFSSKYLSRSASATRPASSGPVTIPGTSIRVPASSGDVEALRSRTDEALQARATSLASHLATPAQVEAADKLLSVLDEELEAGLKKAGSNARVTKQKLAPAERIRDACDSIDLAVAAVAEARSSGTFDLGEIYPSLVELSRAIHRLAESVYRASDDGGGEGFDWLRATAQSQR